MPWQECYKMDERLRFVARLLEGEKMAELCREFDISRKTGYKIFQRYKDCGLEGLTDRSRRPYRHANQLPFQIETLIVRLKREQPELGCAEDPREAAPAAQRCADARRSAPCTRCSIAMAWSSTAASDATRRRAPRCRSRASPTTCGAPTTRASSCSPTGATAIPLTITDFASRYLLSCEALGTTQEAYAFTVFERVFKEFGLPKAIRTDNGVPFASAHALFGLSKLAVWWLRLGIAIERIKPGIPQQNGRHERMHLTLKKEATKPAAQNFLQQQAKFDDFIDCYNHERPHQALDMSYPAELYCRVTAPVSRPAASSTTRSTTDTITVTHCGRICFDRRKINLSTVFAGQNVGIKQVERAESGSSASWTTIWDSSTTRHVGWNRSTTRSGRKCYPCLRNKPLPM